MCHAKMWLLQEGGVCKLAYRLRDKRLTAWLFFIYLLQEDIGFLRLSLSDLKAALIPKPAWLQSEIAQRLPKLACDLYNMFIGDVHLATNTLRSHATCAEEYVEQLKFLDALEVRLALAPFNVSMQLQQGQA